jgi:hypothetical protein
MGKVTTFAECNNVSRYSPFWEGAMNMERKELIKALVNL